MFTQDIYLNNNRRVATIVLVVSMIAFSTVFLLTGMILNQVHGVENQMTLQDYETLKMDVLNGPYAETIRITENTTNLTEGYLIDGYVMTIENATQYSGLGE